MTLKHLKKAASELGLSSWGSRMVLEHPRDVTSNTFGIHYHWQYKICAVPPWRTLRRGGVGASPPPSPGFAITTPRGTALDSLGFLA